jgi:ABC-type glycerol-3-phosphate transport system substrate-binding protein
MRPDSKEVIEWQERYFQDAEGLTDEPYKFYLSKGTHTLGLGCISEAIAIKYIKLNNVAANVNYDAYIGNKSSGTKNYFKKYQAELPYEKSAQSIIAGRDKSNSNLEPSSAYKSKINILSGSSWKAPREWVSYKVNVPESDVYKIGIKYKQNTMQGLKANKKIYINSIVPFEQAKSIGFNYSDDWQFSYIGNNSGNEYLFNLNKGDNIITFETTIGEYATVAENLTECINLLNEIKRKIIMVTGQSPDFYRDYMLSKSIPSLSDDLKTVFEMLNNQISSVENKIGSKGSEIEQLKQLSFQLDKFLNSPDSIPADLTSFSNNIESLSYFIDTIKNQPVTFDYIVIASEEEKVPKGINPSIFESLAYETKSFIYSFFNNYNSLGLKDNSNSLNIWISLGREQAYVLKNLINDSFTPDTKIKINLKIVTPGILIPTIVAGKGPDVVLNLTHDQPLNLALRGAIEPLDEYNGFKDVEKRFMLSSFDPYKLDEKIYAIPETQSFNMMFYRKDILNGLNVSYPKTWQDLIELIPVLQRNNFSVGLPMDQSNFYSLLLQNGQTIYKSDLKATNFENMVAFDTFTTWTQFYTQYGLPLYKDDYSRFKSGELPIVITSYGFANLLQAAAPELGRLWAMVPIPGTMDANGKINNMQYMNAAQGTASAILKTSKNKEAAWQFLDWWSSNKIQSEFAKDIENQLGIAGRYFPANIEALNSISWSNNEHKLLMQQWKNSIEIPEIAGGYYLTRNVDNAFKQVVLRGKNPHESLFYWSKETDREILKKRKEFGLN